jgi:hypothetical protein
VLDLAQQSSSELHFSIEEKQSPLIKIGAALCALFVTAALLAGYFFLQHRQKQRALLAQQQQQAAKKVVQLEAQVFENEARLQGSDAIIGGVVRNISNARIEDLSVEIQLIPRTGETLKTQQIKLEPTSLSPGEEGSYTLSIPSRQWSASRLARLISGARNTEIAFKSEMGERRPLEQPGTRVVIVPRSKGKGDDFLNTPDNPIPIR